MPSSQDTAPDTATAIAVVILCFVVLGLLTQLDPDSLKAGLRYGGF